MKEEMQRERGRDKRPDKGSEFVLVCRTLNSNVGPLNTCQMLLPLNLISWPIHMQYREYCSTTLLCCHDLIRSQLFIMRVATTASAVFLLVEVSM